jgi:membrane protein DedA with SNARE-associated domain
MQDAVAFFVAQGSYGLMFGALILAGMGVPLPEDIVFISGAILAQRGVTSLSLTVAVLAVGTLLGDTVLFFLARRLGPAIYERSFVKRVMPAERRAWVEERIRKHGGWVVFFARHVAGFRGPTFAICAIHGISYPVFIACDAIALAVSMPIFMALGWWFSDNIEAALSGAASAESIVGLGIVGLVLVLAVVHAVRAILKARAAAPAAESAPPPSEPTPPAVGPGASDA